MERQGKLEPYKIYRLLQSLAVAKASCVVVVSYESGGIRISMSEGNVVFLDSDILHYRFPAFLMKTGMISEKVVEEVLLKAEHSEEKFEETLIQSNLMKREDIEKAKHSIVRTLLTVVMSAEGSYSVDMNPSPLPDAAKYTLNLDEALFRNVGMQKDAAFFKRFLTAHKGISLKKTHLFAKLLPLMNSFIFRSKSPGFSLPAEESFMLVNSMIDDDAAAQALFSMIMSGMIAPESGRTQKEAPEPAQAHFQVNGREAHPAYKALLEELDQMKSKNYFELFSVQIDAPVSEIRGKALALSRKFSAERYSGISPDMSYVDVLKEINDLIRRSEEVLTDRLLRSAYNKQLEINIPSLEARIDAIFTALDISNDGRMMLHSNQFEEAVKRFQEAIEIHGEEPDHTINLIKAQLMLSKKTGSGDMPKMLEAILLVISANSMNISARLAKVAVLKALSRNDEAVAELKEILRLDPRNEDARTTLKLSSIKPVEKLQFRKRNDSIFRKMIDYLKG